MTTLYRLFDVRGGLLYVGISEQPFRRLRQHGRRRAWWADVVRVELAHFESRQAALAAELVAIRTERPRFNVVGRLAKPAPVLLASRRRPWLYDFLGGPPPSWAREWLGWAA